MPFMVAQVSWGSNIKGLLDFFSGSKNASFTRPYWIRNGSIYPWQKIGLKIIYFFINFICLLSCLKVTPGGLQPSKSNKIIHWNFDCMNEENQQIQDESTNSRNEHFNLQSQTDFFPLSKSRTIIRKIKSIIQVKYN